MVSPFTCPNINNSGKGLVFSANSTQNAQFAKINGLFGVPFVIDDIITNPNLDFTGFIYTLATGEEKSRCNSDGTLKDSNMGWHGVAITSSELPITEYTKQFKGINARVLHTQGIVWTESARQAEDIKRVIKSNYGFTGREFADFISKKSVDELLDEFNSSLDCVNGLMTLKDSLSDRIANKVAIIHLTLELMNECFSLSLDAERIISLLIDCEQKSITDRDPATKALDAIKSYVFTNQSHFYFDSVEDEDFSDLPVNYPNQPYGIVIIDRKNSRIKVKILADMTERILQGSNVSEIATVRKTWRERGISECDRDHNTIKVTMPLVGRIRCDVLTFSLDGKELTDLSQNSAEEEPAQEPPLSGYAIDDGKAIDKIFGSEDEDND